MKQFKILIALLFAIMPCITKAQVNVNDSLALVALYNSTNGPGWTNHTNWLTGPVNTWFGISVYDGRVTNIYLIGNHLIGQIPEEIGNLTIMSGLTLSHNGLSGQIPAKLGNLSRVYYLLLEYNQLSGEVPAQLFNLTNLQVLHLFNNQLSGQIPAEIGNLTQLYQLYLYSNQFTSLPSLPNNLNKGANVGSNQLTFDDIVPNISKIYTYTPQANVGLTKTTHVTIGGTFTIDLGIDATIVNNTYNWYKDFQLYSTTSINKLVINNVALANVGVYTCKITNPDAPDLTLNSNPETLIVDDIPIQIITQPISVVGCPGTSATFSVVATGATALTYSWLKDGAPIANTNNTSYTINNISPTDAGSYDVVINSTGGSSVTSNSATLTVNATPVITEQPVALTINAGQSASFTVVAIGATSYQWRKNGVNIAGANNASYTVSNCIAANAGSYDVVIANANNCSITSNAATLTVYDCPVITTQPLSTTQCMGTTATFSVTATKMGSTSQSSIITEAPSNTFSKMITVNAIIPGPSITYQWRKDGVNIIGANSATYTIVNCSLVDAGNYDVVVTYAGKCSVTSDLATLSVTSTAAPMGNATQVFCALSNPAVANLAAIGTSIQWYLTPTGGQALSPITALTDGTVYYASQTNGGCESTSRLAVTVAITPAQPASVTISANPGTTVDEGTSIIFTTTPTNGGTLPSYQWSKGAIPVSGATASTYTYTPVNDDAISVTMTSNAQCVTGSPANSNIITMKVIAKPCNISVTINAIQNDHFGNDPVVYLGYEPLSDLTLQASVQGGIPPYIYDWSPASNGDNKNDKDGNKNCGHGDDNKNCGQRDDDKKDGHGDNDKGCGHGHDGHNTQSSVEVEPVVNTTYYLTVTDAAGCIATDEILVKVVDVRCGNKNDKVTICVLPASRKDKAHEICVSPNAVPAHLKNGDLLGSCECAHTKSAETDNTELAFTVYPNPSDLDANIKFTISTDTYTTIDVLDITGKSILTLFQSTALAGTNYELIVPKLRSGIYFIRMTTPGNVSVNKLIFE